MHQFGSFILDILQTIVVAFAIFILIWWQVAQPHKVDGRSMASTFCHGDMLLTDKLSYTFRDPERYDVVIFKSPLSPSRDLIKRVIGLPGETIELRSGTIFIDGVPLDEGFLAPDVFTNAHPYLNEGTPREIGTDELVVLGDNRPHSNDSREFGPIKKQAIKGRSFLRYWPLLDFGMVLHGPVRQPSNRKNCS